MYFSTKMVLVSVVTICRNAKNTIRRCLDSILNQTYPDIEVVVVDSSDDDTKNIVEEYKNKSKFPFKIIRQEPKGVGAARNAGIENSEGDVIIFVDADCYISSEFVEKVVAPFNMSDSVLTVYTGIKACSASKTLFSKVVDLQEELMFKDKEEEKVGIWVTRKSLYNLIGMYDEKLKVGEDIELVNRLRKMRKELEKKNYIFTKVNADHFEDKQERTFLQFYKKCIWYGEPLANKRYFMSDFIGNFLKLIGAAYLTFLPFLIFITLMIWGISVFTLTLVIPFILLFVYIFYRVIERRKLNRLVPLVPFVAIYKSIFLLVGFVKGLYRNLSNLFANRI